MSLFSFLKQKFIYSASRSIGLGWDKARKDYLDQHQYCEICGYLPKEKERQNDVHHIIPRHIDPSKLLDNNNFITLCRKYDCHLRFGHFGDYRKYWNPNIRSIFQDTGKKMSNEEILIKIKVLEGK